MGGSHPAGLASFKKQDKESPPREGGEATPDVKQFHEFMSEARQKQKEAINLPGKKKRGKKVRQKPASAPAAGRAVYRGGGAEQGRERARLRSALAAALPGAARRNADLRQFEGPPKTHRSIWLTSGS